jgi:hypothetical protein
MWYIDIHINNAEPLRLLIRITTMIVLSHAYSYLRVSLRLALIAFEGVGELRPLADPIGTGLCLSTPLGRLIIDQMLIVEIVCPEIPHSFTISQQPVTIATRLHLVIASDIVVRHSQPG